jgi:tetratricopeptide (TPR) repeat protein
MLAISTRHFKGEEAAIEVFEEGLKAAPDDPELLYQRGHSLVALRRFDEAKKSYERVLQQNIDDHLSSLDVGIVNFKAQHALAGAHLADGDYRSAKESYLRVLETAPHFTPSAFELFNAALDIADFATARDMLGKVQQAEGASDNWLQMTERYAEAVGGEGNVIEALRSAVSSAPGINHVRMSLCRRLLNAGMESEAIPHLHLLAEAGKSEAAFYLGVIHTRNGKYRPALAWMERALSLAPGHEATIEQVEKLREMVSNTEEPPENEA